MISVDYATYSPRELYEALSSIDADRYPETFAALQTEIESRTDLSQSELWSCYAAIDRAKWPEYANRLAEQIRQSDTGTSQQHLAKGFYAPVTEENKYKTFWRRFWALIIDLILLSPLAFVGLSASVGSDGPDLQRIAWIQQSIGLIVIVYFVLMHAFFGQTLGKMAVGAKVLTADSEKAIGLRHALLRDSVPLAFLVFTATYLAYYGITTEAASPSATAQQLVASASIAEAVWAVAELLTMLFNKKRRAVHDFIAGTVVVRIQNS